jgi:4-nitrophenyl phosphatase
MIRAAIFDIDGTLALMDKATGSYTALPGAVQAVKTLSARMPLVAYTNGTFFPPAHYYPLLAAAGLQIEPGHLLTPATVAARALAQTYKRVMVVGAEGTKTPLRDAGIEVVDAIPGAEAEAVLIGWTHDFGAQDLEAAAQAVWAGAPVYATSVAPYFASAKGRMLGISGAIAAAIQNATGVKPVVFGKPETAGMDVIAALTGVAPAEMAVIGDDPHLEITMARRAGALAIGVTTGIADKAAFAAVDPALRAHHILTSLNGLADIDGFTR